MGDSTIIAITPDQAKALRPGVDIEVVNRARRALAAFHRLRPQMAAFARIMTGRSDVQILPTSGAPATDGKAIYIRPNLGLGDHRTHPDKRMCNVRSASTNLLVCKACMEDEEVLVSLFHEIGHIVYDSFEAMDEYEKRKAIDRALAEADKAGVTSRLRLDAIKEKFRALPPSNYVEAANRISPFLPMLLNALEDARVNHLTIEARPGMRVMFAASEQRIFEEGNESLTGETIYWNEAPPNAQALIGTFIIASGIPLQSGWLSDEVTEALSDDHLRHLLGLVRESPSVKDVYRLAFPILERLRALGYCNFEDDEPEPEEQPQDGVPADAEPDQEDTGGDDDSEGPSSEQPSPSPSMGDDPRDEPDTEAADDAESDDEGAADTEAADEGEEGNGGTWDSEERDDLGTGADDPDDDTDEEAPTGDDDASGAGDDDDPDDDPTEDATDDTGDPRNADGSSEEDDDDDEGDSSSASVEDGDGAEEDGGDGEDGSTAEEDDGDAQDFDPGSDGSSASDEDGWDGSEDDSDSDGTDDIEGDDKDAGKNAEEGDPDPYQGKGTPSDVGDLLTEFGGHDHDEEEVSPEEEEALDRAIEQDKVFDAPSDIVHGVRVHHLENPITDERGRLVHGGAWGRAPMPVEVDERNIQSAVIPMRKAFAANKQGAKTTNLRSGRVNARALAKKVPVQDDRIFQKRRRPAKRDYHVVIGLDVSGSTMYGRISRIKAAAYMQAELCHRVGVPFEVWAHTGDMLEDTELDPNLQRKVMGYPNQISLEMFPVKELHENWGDKTKDRLWSLRAYQVNLDGHTMEFYRKRLETTQATDKLLIYYTDGEMPNFNYDEELAILQRELDIFRKKGFSILGVGIDTDSPKKHGLDTVAVYADSDVRKVVMELEKRLA